MDHPAYLTGSLSPTRGWRTSVGVDNSRAEVTWQDVAAAMAGLDELRAAAWLFRFTDAAPLPVLRRWLQEEAEDLNWHYGVDPGVLVRGLLAEERLPTGERANKRRAEILGLPYSRVVRRRSAWRLAFTRLGQRLDVLVSDAQSHIRRRLGTDD